MRGREASVLRWLLVLILLVQGTTGVVLDTLGPSHLHLTSVPPVVAYEDGPRQDHEVHEQADEHGHEQAQAQVQAHEHEHEHGHEHEHEQAHVQAHEPDHDQAHEDEHEPPHAHANAHEHEPEHAPTHAHGPFDRHHHDTTDVDVVVVNAAELPIETTPGQGSTSLTLALASMTGLPQRLPAIGTVAWLRQQALPWSSRTPPPLERPPRLA